MKTETITLNGGGGINWTWYLKIQLTSKTKCRIIKHWRLHKEGGKWPKTIGTYFITEDEKPLPDGWHTRNAIKVRIWRGSNDGPKGKLLTVTNPGYVFGYDGHTQQPAMHEDK